MPKASVDITSASREEIETLLKEFGLEGLYVNAPHGSVSFCFDVKLHDCPART